MPPVSKTGATEIQTASRWDCWHKTVPTGFQKPVPPGLLWQTQEMCTCGFCVSQQLTWVTWALRHSQNTLWCILLDSTAYLYSRSNIKAKSCTWASSTWTMPYFVNMSIWELHPSLSLWNEHFNLELVTWTFVFEWNPLLVQITSSQYDSRKIWYFANINTIHDQDSSSWIQRTFLHSSINPSAQPNCPSPSLVPRNTIPDSNSSSLHHIELHICLYHI